MVLLRLSPVPSCRGTGGKRAQNAAKETFLLPVYDTRLPAAGGSVQVLLGAEGREQ